MAKYQNSQPKSKQKKKVQNVDRNFKFLIGIPLLALLLKFITIANTYGGGWFGADGENYAAGVDGLLRDGFFSEATTLSYWPSGYSILLWPLAAISVSKLYYFLSVIQSIFFAYATYYFTKQLHSSSLRSFAIWASIFISLNPTLALSSMSVGYENPVASSFLMIAGIIWANANPAVDRKFWLNVSYVSAWFALIAFMQPRFMVSAIVIAVLWALRIAGRKNQIRLAALITAITLIAPTIMIYRNSEAIDRAVISTNLSATMKIGAGTETSGGYIHSGPDIECPASDATTSQTDSDLVFCTLEWYVKNPSDSARLAFNKTLFFWSPWSGPKKDGTMARNPWLNISPAHQIVLSSQGGRDFVYSTFGNLISYLWIIGQIFFLFLGIRALRKIGQDEKFLAQIAFTPVLLSWLIAIGTIGDHRFRIPTMGLSLFLQVIGMLALRRKISKAEA
jgi:hypothetical protein